ncbi:sensor histidine kinase [Muricomes intestini]|uniref:histidine kinase n=1 Tax=Muricomes intestini TaxID=1796634 RepID=A0A4R3KGI5_9FIRM|nr:sensor histidine kinase [Muricomes intestini]TCS82223.1 two-component system sensor histidine kinase YesM [Muricomes intestini]
MRSIRSKVLVSILLIAVITASGITVIFYVKSAATIEENYIASNQQQNRQIIESLDQAMQEVYHVLVEASCDEAIKAKIKEYTTEKEDKTLAEMVGLLQSYNERDTAISSFHLIISDEQVLVTSEAYPKYKKVIERRSIQALIKETENQAGPLLLNNLISGRRPHLAFVEPINDNGTVGYLCANIEERYLYYNYISEMRNDTIKEVMLLDQKNEVITTGDDRQGEALTKTVKVMEGKFKDSGAGSQDVSIDEETIYFYSRAPFSRCALYLSVDRETVLGDLTELRLYYAGILVISLIVASILASYLARLIYRPVQNLTSTVKHVSEGELSTRAQVISRDEMGDLATEFNQMLNQIELLIKELIEKERLKKDAELEALQYQVTPHFMYNTLNSIKYAALIKGERELADLIESFVELLQASISKKGAFLTVSEEVHILQNYVRLQEFRSNTTIKTVYNIEPAASNCLIPRLILQPIVENAILHGIDIKKGNGLILISAVVSGERLEIEIKDNGRGMSKEQIRTLLNSKVKKTKGFTAVGIPNVRDRLELYYGEKSQLRYVSDDRGTTVMIYLPAAYDEKE